MLSKSFYAMKNRCCNPNHKTFNYYGGRGITICKEWLNPEIIKTETGRATKGWLAFKEWALNNGYAEGLTLDRIDTNKGYSPENCRWTTMKEQCNNKRNNHLITYKGKTQNLKQWCEELNLNYRIMESRLNRYNWDIKKAFETKTNFRMVMITYKNKTQTLKKWCDELGLNYKLTHSRIHRLHWTIEKAFEIKGAK